MTNPIDQIPKTPVSRWMGRFWTVKKLRSENADLRKAGNKLDDHVNKLAEHIGNKLDEIEELGAELSKVKAVKLDKPEPVVKSKAKLVKDTPENFKLTPEEVKANWSVIANRHILPGVGKILKGIKERFPALGVSDVKVKRIARGWREFDGVKIPESIVVSFTPSKKRKYQDKHDISLWVEADNGWQKVVGGYVVKRLPLYWSQPGEGWVCRIKPHQYDFKYRVGVRSVYDMSQVYATGGLKWSDIAYSEAFTLAELFGV